MLGSNQIKSNFIYPAHFILGSNQIKSNFIYLAHFIPGGNTMRLTEGTFTNTCKETQIFQRYKTGNYIVTSLKEN